MSPSRAPPVAARWARFLADRTRFATGELLILYYSTPRRDMIYKMMSSLELPGAGLVQKFLTWRDGTAALTTDGHGSTGLHPQPHNTQYATVILSMGLPGLLKVTVSDSIGVSRYWQ